MQRNKSIKTNHGPDSGLNCRVVLVPKQNVIDIYVSASNNLALFLEQVFLRHRSTALHVSFHSYRGSLLPDLESPGCPVQPHAAKEKPGSGGC